MDTETRQVVQDALRAAGREDMADALRWFEAMAPHVNRLQPAKLADLYCDDACLGCGVDPRSSHALIWSNGSNPQPCWVFEAQRQLDPGFLVAELRKAHEEALGEDEWRARHSAARVVVSPMTLKAFIDAERTHAGRAVAVSNLVKDGEVYAFVPSDFLPATLEHGVAFTGGNDGEG